MRNKKSFVICCNGFTSTSSKTCSNLFEQYCSCEMICIRNPVKNPLFSTTTKTGDLPIIVDVAKEKNKQMCTL